VEHNVNTKALLEVRYSIPNAEKNRICGSNDCYLKQIEGAYGVQIINREDGLFKILGTTEKALSLTTQTLDQFRFSLRQGCEPDSKIVARVIESIFEPHRVASQNHFTPFSNAFNATQHNPSNLMGKIAPVVMRNRLGEPVQARTDGQIQLIQAIQNNDIVFANGPAGTGKTFLAVALAVAALERREVERIFLVRPAVEAGENLGFLPGDLKEKISPYLRPIYDSLQELLPKDRLRTYNDGGAIEIAPLAYMRGRTLKQAFIILDEAQNTTISQMKMFLTRIGSHSKTIITGDESQVDLNPRDPSGFSHALQLLQNIQGIGHVYLKPTEVLRHPLVQKIIEAYEGVPG
jgi:phosphate starvation-inducible protein PhoH and related proteins